jgi:hypothetical protein
MKTNTNAKLLALSAASIITSSVAQATTLAIQNYSFEDTANSGPLNSSWYNPDTGKTVYWGNADQVIQAWTPSTTGAWDAGTYLVNLPGAMADGNQEVSSTMWNGTGNVTTRTYSGTTIGTFTVDSAYTLALAVQVTGRTGRITLNLLDQTTSAVVGTNSVTLSAGSAWQDLTVTANSGYTVGDTIGISFSFDNIGYLPSDGKTAAQFGADNVRLNVAPIPEPTSSALLVGGLAGLALVRRRRA